MRAILRTEFGGPEVLVIREMPEPEPKESHAVIEVKAFGLNHAELHMRKGEWAEIADVSGIEGVGIVKSCPGGEFPLGLTFFGSFVFGTPGFPLSDVPLSQIAADAAAGRLDIKPLRVFGFDEIQEAHRVMESNQAGGKMVVVLN
jgi:NADPH:quinone reductase-like Zn-dependent oxidoreductase